MEAEEPISASKGRSL